MKLYIEVKELLILTSCFISDMSILLSSFNRIGLTPAAIAASISLMLSPMSQELLTSILKSLTAWLISPGFGFRQSQSIFNSLISPSYPESG